MKLLTTLGLLCLSILVFGQQKLDIAIIGTVHHFKDEYLAKQNFSKARQFIVDFNPDIFCIEAIPVYDTLSLREILPKNMERANQLRDTLIHYGLFSLKTEAATSVSSKGNTIFLENENPQILKGGQFYARYDFWNAFYLWDGIRQKGDSLGYFSKYLWNLDNTEFRHIIFPAARQLGIEQFYGIDYRQGEDRFLDNNNKVMKKLLFSFKWKPLRLYLKTKKRYKKAEKEGKLIEFINSSEFQDSFSKLINDLSQKLPKSREAKETKAYWLKRNRIMAERLISTAREQKARKIVLSVGSAHVSPIKSFLEAKGHQVTIYGTYISNYKN